MREPSRYPAVLDVAYVLVTPIYLLIAVLGYLMYGRATEDEITKNMIKAAGSGVVVKIALWLVAANPLCKYALTLTPVALSLEELVLPRAPSSKLAQRLVSITLRTLLTFLTMGIGVAIPDFARVVSFIGALFSFM